MIYLENKTELQELWIPRNDGQGVPYNPTYELEGVDVTISQDITVVNPSSGYYGMSAVTIDASEYGQSNYDEGFDDGYTDGYSSGTSDGEQSIIDTFTSTTITINGQYGSSANPYSSVTVDVAQTGHTDQELQEAYESGYTSGSTDGYNSGYTSGETHQKSLLVSTSITENGEYQRENGYSAITVNVPTGQTYNIEPNKPFTATSNGNYTITPTSASTNVTHHFDSDDDRYYCTVNADINSYPSVGYFELVRIEDEFDESKGYIDVYIDDGVLDYDNSWNPRSDADIDIWSDSVEIVIYNANRYIGWSPLEDYTFSYDVMSAVSLNVNVETASTYQSGYTDGQDNIIGTFSSMTATTNGVYGSSAHPLSSITVDVPQSGGSGTTVITPVDYIHTTILSQSDNHIDTGIIPTTATTFRVQGMYKGVAQGGTVVGYSYNDSKDYRLFWAGNGGSPKVYYDFNNQRLGSYRNILYDGTLIDATCDNYSLTLNGNVLGTGTTQTTISDPHSIMIDVCSWWVKSLEIWDGSTKVFDGIAAYDENGNIGLYDSVSKQLFYNSELTMDYETSGSNLGTGSFSTNGTYSALSYNYDGFSSVTINVPTLPLSSITITANTVITETQFAYSAITVNVPQSGCSGVKYVEYIETDGTYIGFDFSTAHTYSSLDETICLDFMPLNGTVYSDTYYGFMGADNLLLWTIPYGYRVNDKYGLCIGDFNMYYGWSSGPTFSAGTRFDCAFSSTGANINNVDYPFTVTSVGTPGYIRLNWNGDISNPRCPVARYYGFKLMSGDTVICNYRPAIDNNGIPCFYEETTGEYYYKNPICSGTPIAGPVLPSPDYQSGYTDGYASGYTDGSASIASLIDRSITEAVIPSGVTKIGDQAFAACQNLKSITIPNSVTSINNNAFYCCYSLSSITIPSGVTLLGGGCFYNNYALSSITIPNSVTYLGDNVFYSCQALTSVTFSNSLTKIPSSCCYGCKLLPNVTIPNSITTIDSYSFQNCSALTEVNIGSGITTINSNAFKNCIVLVNIYISATTAPTIANANAFQGVPSTGTVHYPQGSDYSSWQSNTYLSGWTFIADL